MAHLFQKQAGIYAATRPTYPPALFSLLSSLTKRHERAWDVGTGNGQAAVALAELYDQVIATDVSDQQLKHAEQRTNIAYRCTSMHVSREELEKTVGEEGSVDLVTVATAIHWFDLPSFYSNVKHVLRKSGGLLAVWSYNKPSVSPEVDTILADFFRSTRPYNTQSTLDMMDDGFKSLYFPFEPVLKEGTGPLKMDSVKETTLEGLIGLLNSASTVHTAREGGVELVSEELKEALKEAWGDPHQLRTITFPLFLRIGTSSLEPPIHEATQSLNEVA